MRLRFRNWARRTAPPLFGGQTNKKRKHTQTYKAVCQPWRALETRGSSNSSSATTSHDDGRTTRRSSLSAVQPRPPTAVFPRTAPKIGRWAGNRDPCIDQRRSRKGSLLARWLHGRTLLPLAGSQSAGLPRRVCLPRPVRRTRGRRRAAQPTGGKQPCAPSLFHQIARGRAPLFFPLRSFVRAPAGPLRWRASFLTHACPYWQARLATTACALLGTTGACLVVCVRVRSQASQIPSVRATRARRSDESKARAGPRLPAIVLLSSRASTRARPCAPAAQI